MQGDCKKRNNSAERMKEANDGILTGKAKYKGRQCLEIVHNYIVIFSFDVCKVYLFGAFLEGSRQEIDLQKEGRKTRASGLIELFKP